MLRGGNAGAEARQGPSRCAATLGGSTVPKYEYLCKDCGEKLEVAQSFTDEALSECPVCGGVLRKVFGSIGVVLKGSGFYRNDSRTSSSGRPRSESGSSDAGGSDKASSESSASDKSVTSDSSEAGIATKTSDPSPNKPKEGSKPAKESGSPKKAASASGSAGSGVSARSA